MIKGNDMKKTFCDCCKREIGEFEKIFSMYVANGASKEMHIKDMCIDCYDRIKQVVDNAERWRREQV